MKKRKFLKLGILLTVIFIAIIIIVIYIEYRNNNLENLDNNVQAYYCGGNHCLKDPGFGGTVISYKNCEVCNKRMSFPTTDVDTLCASCSAKTKRCKHCGEKLTDEQITQNKLQQSQTTE